MNNLESQPRNLENELLKGLRNQTVIGKIQNQVIKESDILPHIQILNAPGDVLKIIGLKSNRPKKFTWDYDQKKFGPGETVTHKAEITDNDKLIFYTVFSEPIEKIAVGDKVTETIAKQAHQVSYDIADFYDEEFTQKYACDLNRYHKNAIVRLNSEQMLDMQRVSEIAVTTGYQMASPSTLFNKREERCNVKSTKKLLCFIDNSLYGRGEVSSIYKSPSPALEALERNFTVIKCNMVNNVKLALIDADAIYLWSSLNQRYLKLDEYVACHKLLDHIWRKWIFVDYRPAFALVLDKTAKSEENEENNDKKEEWDSSSFSNDDDNKFEEYLNSLKEILTNFIKYDSGEEIKKNSKNFWKKTTKELEKFNSNNVKVALGEFLGTIKPSESDTDAFTRFEEVKTILLDKGFIEKSEENNDY